MELGKILLILYFMVVETLARKSFLKKNGTFIKTTTKPIKE
jgi:hypothetical protein